MDQINNAAFLSAATRNRSSSATPMRTPNRPIPHADMGGPLTSEKERMPLDDKKFLQTQASRITEYLHEVEDLLGKDFFSRGGLKSMSTKQFVVIFSHFLKFIAGNRLSIGTAYVDDVVSVLGQIGYPYTINKSWLKTPNAPHSFNNVVILFGWMLDFVPRPDFVEDFENEYLVVPEDLPDKEFALKFMSSAKEGFSLWNNSKNEEFNNLKEETSNIFIRKRNQGESLEQVHAEIKQVASDLKELDRSKSRSKYKEEASSFENECNQLEGKVRLNEVCVSKSVKTCEDNEKHILRLEEQSEHKQGQIIETQRRIECIEGTVKTQRMSTAERAELITHIQYLKQLLESKKKTVFELQDKDACNQVAHSRLVKQTIDAVAAFNNYVQKIFSDQSDLLDCDIEELCIDQNSEMSIEEQIERILPLLEKAKGSSFQQIKSYTQEISDLEHALKKVVYEHDTLLEEQLRSTQSKCEEYSKTIEKLDVEIVNKTACHTREAEELTHALEKQTVLNSSLREKINFQNEELTRLAKENELMFAETTEKMEAYLQAKKRNVHLLEEGVKYLEDANLKLKDIS